MELINLLFLCLSLYIFTITSFLTKILIFIVLSFLISIFLNLENYKNSNNLFLKIIYVSFSFFIFLVNNFISLIKQVMELNTVKYFVCLINNLNKSYIEGRNYLFFSIVNNVSNSYKKMKLNINDEKKMIEENYNKKKIFNNDNEMFDFLDNLDVKKD